MSRALDTLLKLAQRRLDSLAIEAAQATGRLDEVRVRQAQLAAREEGEAAAAQEDILLMQFLPAYQERVRMEAAAMAAQERAIDGALADVRQRMAAAYQEKAKLEQLIQMQAQRREKTLAEREQAALDEAAINLSVRR